MRGLCCVVALALCALVVSASDAYGATCTAAQKRKNVAALKKFQRGMAVQRRAYFLRHRSPKARRAFVHRQQARLRALRKAAACRVRTRQPSPQPQPQPPTPQPPPPQPGRPDVVVSMSASGGSRIHEPIAYTVVVENRGTAPAAGVSLTSALPPGLQRVAAQACTGIRVLACPVGAIAPGASMTRRIDARPLQTGEVTLTVSVTATGDADPSNDAAAVTRPVDPLPTYPAPAETGFAFQLARPSWADTSPVPSVGEWPKNTGEFHAGTGSLRGGVLFVDFPDRPGTGSELSPAEATALLESTASAWYAEASYGRMNLTLTAIPGWYRMSKPVGEYGIGLCCDWAKQRAFVAEAVGTADPTVDFSAFDALWVIGPTTAWDAMTILVQQSWPGQGITADGRELRRWITAPASYPSIPTQVEPARFAHWVATHEIGHFLGLPDLYLKPPGCLPCPNTFEAVGYWDLMSETPLHAHFLAWHKWLLGWLDPAQMRLLGAPGSIEVDLAPGAAGGGIKAVVVPLSTSLAYVVEAREPMGWEAGLCDRGVLVYTVDSTKSNAQGPVQLKPAHASGASPVCGPTWHAAYDKGPGEVAVFEDAAAGLRVEVLERRANGLYAVRVTKS